MKSLKKRPPEMNLKILLPYQVFADVQKVGKIVVETNSGSYGVLPLRLDFTAALVPGILTYETKSEGINYVAVTEGILVKAGSDVMVSVRNAIGNAPLGELQGLVDQELVQLDKVEIDARQVMAKLEIGFMRNFQNLKKQ